MKLTELFNKKEIKAPNSTAGVHNGVFLAGSIEMGKAEPWQERLVEMCEDADVVFLNPRRDDWDSSWKQEIGNKKFREQVEWELNSMEQAEKIVVYIDPKTTSPITLMEIGIHVHSKKMCVCCPDGFYRKGNVDIVCNHYGVPMVENLEGLAKFIKG